MTGEELICIWREQLELRLGQVRGRRQQCARSALASVRPLELLMQDPAVERAVLLAIDIKDALPRGKPRGAPVPNNRPAIAGKSGCKASAQASTVGAMKREAHP